MPESATASISRAERAPAHPDKSLRIMGVDLTEPEAERILDALRASGYEPTLIRVSCAADLEQALAGVAEGVIIASYGRSTFSGLTALARAKERGCELPFLFLSDAPDEDLAREAIREGAYDFLQWNRLSRLGMLVARAQEHQRLREARHQAESRLHESEKRLRLALDAAHLGDWEWDIVTGEISWSDACKRLYGLEPETVITYDLFLAAVHPDDRGPVADALARAVAERTEYDVEKRILWPDGTIRWTASRGRVFCDTAGRPIRMSGVSYDVTERRRTETQLAQDHRLLRTLIDHMPSAIFVKDAAGRYLISNVEHTKMVGARTESELVGKTVYDFYPQPLARTFDEDDKVVLRTGTPVIEREAPSETDAELLWYSTTKVPLRDLRNHIIGTIGIKQDITGRKRAETAMEMMQFSVDRAGDSIFWLNREGRIRYVNDAACTSRGYTREELLGMCIFDLDPDYQPGVWAPHFEELKRRGTITFETRHRAKDGRVYPLEVNATYVFINGQEFNFCFLRDITTRKRAEITLRESEDRYRSLVENSPDGIGIYREMGLVFINRAGVRLFGAQQATELLGRTGAQLIHPEDYPGALNRIHRRLAGEVDLYPAEVRYVRLDGSSIPVEVSAAPIVFEGKPALQFVARDITVRRREELLLAWENSALELIGSAAPLGEVLDGLALGLEQQLPGTLCSMLLLDADGLHLRHGAGPSLPPAYNEAINGIAIGPHVGSCGTAVYTNRQVIVTNIGTDPLWTDFRDLALGHGLHACWSTPIAGSQGKTLGTFAIYCRVPRSPTADERELIGRAAKIVRIAIERKRSESALQESQATLANAQRIAKVGNWELEFDPQTHPNHPQLTWSDEVFRLFGYPPGGLEVTRDNFYRAVHPDDRAAVQAAMAAALQQRTSYNFIHRIVLPDGTERIVQEQSEIQISDPAGQRLRMVGTVQDITALKRTEQALADSESLYHSLMEHLPLSVFRKDREGRLTFANARFCEAAGKPLAEILGRTDFEIAPPDLAQKYRADDLRIMATGEAMEAMEENRFIPGQKRFIQVLKAPLRNSAGEIVGIQGIFLDVTEHKELEEKLRQSQKMEAIGQLAGGVAHDFNNILTIIQGFTGLLLDEENLPTAMRDPLLEIYSAGERAANLTRQLLAYSRKQEMRRVALDLNDVVNNVAKMLQRLLGEDITLHLSHSLLLPPIYADAGMLEQVFMNLAINARDAMPRGGQLRISTGRIQLADGQPLPSSEARPGEFVWFSVSDTGSGIAAELLPRIFEPFFTTKEVGKGTGLGLATVFGIVKQHDGWLTVESQAAAGTTFRVYLPARPALEVKPPGESAPGKPLPGTETILLVEDDAVVRGLVSTNLRRFKYRVLEASSGSEALRVWRANQGKIDLLLTDMVMPGGLNGRELAEQLLEHQPGLKVIYSSGYSPESVGTVFPLPGGMGYLAKPYRQDELIRKVRDCLDHSASLSP